MLNKSNHFSVQTTRSNAVSGFKGEITLSNPGNMERISISLWENKTNAEAYDVNVYPEVLKILSKVIDGTPKIRIFEAVALNLDHGTLAERKSS
jgi:hypothetical protein